MIGTASLKLKSYTECVEQREIALTDEDRARAEQHSLNLSSLD